MKETICSKDKHQELIEKSKDSYCKLLQDLKDDLNEGFSSEFMSEEFLDTLQVILNDKTLFTYSPMKLYWTHLIDNFTYIVQLHEEISGESNFLEKEMDFTDLEEEIFEFWKNTDLCESFVDTVNVEKSIDESSKFLLPILEDNIISFYNLHLNEGQYIGKTALYLAIPEIGDNERRLYSNQATSYIDFEILPENYPVIPISMIKGNAITLQVHDEGNTIQKSTVKDIIEHKDLSLKILPRCSKGIREAKAIRNNIGRALSIIEKTSTDLFNTLSSFTHTVIPVDEEGIVSYSSQYLPGFSCINVFDRDFVDLIDDLLHENGHHYLNVYLNDDELINEDDDQIYFSPWRRALRPVRGIYHAVFTFYWALETFGKLSANDEILKSEFDEAQIDKIRTRYVEEFHMLKYCKEDIEHAYKHEKINKNGYELINNIFELVSSHKENVNILTKQLSETSSNKIVELKELLIEKRAHYKLT